MLLLGRSIAMAVLLLKTEKADFKQAARAKAKCVVIQI